MTPSVSPAVIFKNKMFRLELRYYRGFHKWAFATAEVLVQLFREEKNVPEILFAMAEVSLQPMLL